MIEINLGDIRVTTDDPNAEMVPRSDLKAFGNAVAETFQKCWLEGSENAQALRVTMTVDKVKVHWRVERMN